MKRCYICDLTSQKISWDNKIKGFICEKCQGIVLDTLQLYQEDDLDKELETLISDDY